MSPAQICYTNSSEDGLKYINEFTNVSFERATSSEYNITSYQCLHTSIFTCENDLLISAQPIRTRLKERVGYRCFC